MVNQTTSTISNPYELHLKLLEVIEYSKRGFVAMGKLLSELKQDDQFTLAVGEGIDTWDDYLAQPEIGLSRGEANRLIQIYEQFCMRLGFDEEYISQIPVKNLHYLLPLVKDMDIEEDVDDLLEDALNLSQRDFKERIYEAKNEEVKYTYEYLVFKRRIETGQLSRVDEVSHEDIINAFNLQGYD